MTEESLHRAVAQYLDLALPPGVWWTTIPAGGGGRIRGAKLKACGYKAGTPDILIVGTACPAFIELKTAKGRLSPAQKVCHAGLKDAHAWVAVCRSLAEVEGTLKGWGIPLMVKL